MTKLEPDEQACVLQALKALPDTLLDSGDLKSSIIDPGASFHATGYLSDFVPGTLKDLAHPLKLDGIAGSLTATKEGTLRHIVLSNSGTEEILEMNGVYMPGLETRLISPQLFFKQLQADGHGEGEYVVRADTSLVRLPNKSVITLGYNSLTNLPMLTCFRNIDDTTAGLAMTCLSDESNQNLNYCQKLLLQWHFRTGHLGFQHLQWCGRQGFFDKAGQEFGCSSSLLPNAPHVNMEDSNDKRVPGLPRKQIQSTPVYSNETSWSPEISSSLISTRAKHLDVHLVFAEHTSHPKNIVVVLSSLTLHPDILTSNTSKISLQLSPFVPNLPSNEML
jgi:hypothetical protein